MSSGVGRDSVVHGIYCGSTLPSSITSESNTLRIEFNSDNSVQKTGFHALFFTGKNHLLSIFCNFSGNKTWTCKCNFFFDFQSLLFHKCSSLVDEEVFTCLVSRKYTPDKIMLICFNYHNWKFCKLFLQIKMSVQ